MTTVEPTDPPRLSPLPDPEGCAIRSDAACTVQRETRLRGQKSVAIQHNGSVYRLQATRLGKLILTK